MKIISLIENIIIEASKKDILVQKLGLSNDNAEVLSELSGFASVWLGNKLIDAFAQQMFERMVSAVPEDEEKRLRELFRKDPEYRKKIGLEAINKGGGVRGMRSNIVSIMDWIRVGLNGNYNQYKNLDFHQLYGESRQWHNQLKTGEGEINYNEENTVLRDYRDENGIGLYWVDLDTNNSKEECNRMGHCGRTDYNNTILSLRETKQLNSQYTINKSLLTAALGDSNGILYQLKGPSNSKPKDIYFPYIVDLILNYDNIKGFGSEYDSANDFSITDLPEDEIRKIYEKKPELFNTRKLKRQLEKMGIGDYKQVPMIFEKSIVPEYVNRYVDGDWTYSQYKNKEGHTVKVGFIETILSGDMWDMVDGYDGDWKGALEYYVDDENKQKIRELIKTMAGENYDENEDLVSLINEYDDNYNIRNAIGSAYSDVANSSYYDYATKQLKNALEEYGTVTKMNDEGVNITIDLMQVAKNMDVDEDTLDEYFENCSDDASCVFDEIMGGYYDKPSFSIDDRWSPDIDDEDLNGYLSERLSEI